MSGALAPRVHPEQRFCEASLTSVLPMIDRCLSLFVAVSLALLVWLYARSRDQEVLDYFRNLAASMTNQ